MAQQIKITYNHLQMILSY